MTDVDHPVSHTYYSQRLRLHYVEWLNDGADPLLLVHGGMDHCRNWDWVVRELGAQFNIVAPDLRGHGDSDWMAGGTYRDLDFVYDIGQLIKLRGYDKVTIIGHSLGGFLSLIYAGLNPDKVKKVVAIEGAGISPKELATRSEVPRVERINQWMDSVQQLSSRQTRRYESLAAALQRMQAKHPNLSEEQASYITKHAARQNEDGSYSWKYDNYLRTNIAEEIPYDEIHQIWQRINCPVLLVRGEDSWASDPVKDGRIKHFKDARLVNVANAGHWVHHDQLDHFVTEVKNFLQE